MHFRCEWSPTPGFFRYFDRQVSDILSDTHRQHGDREKHRHPSLVPITFDREADEFAVSVDDTLTMEAEGARAFNEEVGTITPHPLTSDHEMSTGKSTTATVDYDEQFSWDVSGNNSYLGDFELANA